jgi:hypothetical protein
MSDRDISIAHYLELETTRMPDPWAGPDECAAWMPILLRYLKQSAIVLATL